jgi:hypothetical protein
MVARYIMGPRFVMCYLVALLVRSPKLYLPSFAWSRLVHYTVLFFFNVFSFCNVFFCMCFLCYVFSLLCVLFFIISCSMMDTVV